MSIGNAHKPFFFFPRESLAMYAQTGVSELSEFCCFIIIIILHFSSSVSIIAHLHKTQLFYFHVKITRLPSIFSRLSGSEIPVFQETQIFPFPNLSGGKMLLRQHTRTRTHTHTHPRFHTHARACAWTEERAPNVMLSFLQTFS